MMAPFTGRSSRTNSGSNNRRSSVRLTPMAVTPDHNDSMNTANAVVGTPSNNIAPPQALTDSAVLDTLRSSVATVELPPDCYPPNTRNASANWKTDSVLSNMSMVNMSLTSTSGGCQPPLEIDLPLGGDGGPSPTHNRLGGDPLHPYGIFSSSTRNNPFGNAAVLDSTTSSSGGRMASSTNSRGSLSMSMMGSLPLDMKDLDMDGLLDSMDSMGFQGMMIDPMMIDQ